MLETTGETEWERRFLLLDFERSILPKNRPDRYIQGYFEITDDREFRVRVVNDETAELTAKQGSGMARLEPKHVPALKTARWILDQTIYRVEKNRRVLDGGWELDELLGPLKGIYLLELEKRDVATNLVQPSWVKNWVEVTDTLNNRMLARLNYELEHGDEPGADILRHVLPPSIKSLVLTGAPCSGKTTMLEILKSRFGDRIHCVPEAATLVMSHLNVRLTPDANKTEIRRFQLNLARAMQSFESLSLMQAANDGKKLVIFDRGIPDNAAYLSQGDLAPLASILLTSPKRLYRRYDRVIQLGVPSEKVYERNKANNPQRRETYKQACELDRYITEAWEAHDHYRSVNEQNWDEKVENVLHRVGKLLLAA